MRGGRDMAGSGPQLSKGRTMAGQDQRQVIDGRGQSLGRVSAHPGSGYVSGQGRGRNSAV